MIHYSILKKITNPWKHLSVEKKLACKITAASFIVLVFIIGTIIFSSYLYQKERAYRDLQSQTQNMIRFDSFLERERIDLRNILSFDKGNDARQGGDRKIGPPGRDIIIFDKANTIIRNDIADIDERDIVLLTHLPLRVIWEIELHNTTYLVYKVDSPLGYIAILSNIEPLLLFHTRLIILAAIGSLFGLLLIFLLSLYLANISIAPIKEHNASLEAYNRNVAHELRTPLSVMRSNLDILSMTQSPRLIDSTKEEITSMESIIETLLFLSSPQSKVDLTEAIHPQETIRTLISSYDKESILLNLGKTLPVIHGNTELFHRVLCNLIDNALKYKSEGTVEISFQRKTLRISNNIDHEISPEVLQRLTEAFYQGDTSRHDSGYGLGLSLVKKICDISSWSLSFPNEEKKFIVEVQFL